MNGLTLRISGGGNKKVKNASIGVAAVQFSINFKNAYEKQSEYLQLLSSTTSDDQLKKLKNILDNYKTTLTEEFIIFLAKVFLEAPAKHPLKCFLIRQVTKNKELTTPFSQTLSAELLILMSDVPAVYNQYLDVVCKLFTCIENFPAGADAVKSVQIKAGDYLKEALKCCILALTISDDRNAKSLSPTEKNEIFNLAHLTLRLLLYIVQRANHFITLSSMFNDIRSNIKYLLFDEDVPMDTKSLSGILLLTMYVLENGEKSWIHILQNHQPDDLKLFLTNDAAQLSLYSAIAIVVPVDELQVGCVDGVPALVALIHMILAIGERNSSDATFTLGVTRTVLLIAKCLDKVQERALGLAIVDSILVFIWSHLEHYMDSVRHLTAQSLALAVKYCTRLRTEGDDTALRNLFAALTSLDCNRKSYYVSLTSLTNELGATYILDHIDGLIVKTISALSIQAVQASATTALETLLQKHVKETNSRTIYVMWVRPILSYVLVNTLDSDVLNIFENILAKVVRQDEGLMEFILPHIKQPGEGVSIDDGNLKCVLMLLSVARKSGVAIKYVSSKQNEWKGLISYEVLKTAAIDAVDETRILSLSLVVESTKSTELFTHGDFDFILYFLKYNINTQSPNFRQLVLSFMKKFMKRLEESYKVLKRQNEPNGDTNLSQYYLDFVEELRRFCFDCLIQGANYSRKYVALQTLVWCEELNLEGYSRTWKEEYVEKLLQHLEDSYESNKAYALQILSYCPVELLEKDKAYSVSLRLETVLEQASCVKPTECVSAAYKLKLINKKLPHRLIDHRDVKEITNVSTYNLLQQLLKKLKYELSVAQTSILTASSKGPMYGLLHCICHVLKDIDPNEIRCDESWSRLVSDLILISLRVNEAVSPVVNNSSPEGHLPMDRDHDTSRLSLPGDNSVYGGNQVTAQMVLLCAWRSVKEVSLLLGEISSRLSIEGEGQSAGTVSHEQLLTIGRHLTDLLAETKHRGAFEQAYVGFTMLLTRLWRCRSSSLHSLPSIWLSDLTSMIVSGHPTSLCATRRSAGLPFIIQALVTTELQVNGNPKCFHQCMSMLLQLAHYDPAVQYTPAQVETRTHALNILRALFRNSVLCERAAGAAGSGVRRALAGFDASTWPERNSSTLLFSALMVRIFGVQRTKDTDKLCVRNKMTGRIFFLRYPELYDFMLDKLKEVSCNSDSQLLKPSLYPILLLLARLYPSSLEGTVSNLKLVAFIPHVLSCSRSCVLKTRQLAAKAMVPLISPERYLAHLEEMFQIICDKSVARNYCHGVLLQLLRILDAPPENLTLDSITVTKLSQLINGTFWIVEQALGDVPCYLITDEYVKIINLILWRFPSLITQEMLEKLENILGQLIFSQMQTSIISGRDICLGNSLNLYYVVSNINKTNDSTELIIQSLSHSTYEVVLTTLNYLLMLYEKSDPDIQCRFLNHLNKISPKIAILNNLRNDGRYLFNLCQVLITARYLECIQKTLKVLSLEENTQRMLIRCEENGLDITDDEIITKLIDCINTEHENLTHIYLSSLLQFVAKNLKCVSKEKVLNVMGLVYDCSSSENSDAIREVVIEFLERNIQEVLEYVAEFNEDKKFESLATLISTIGTLLEDDSDAIRRRTSDIVTEIAKHHKYNSAKVLPSRSAEVLREIVNVSLEDADEKLALHLVLSLLDFKSEVCITVDGSDEARVFDQNERYNIFLEETIWTHECALKIRDTCDLYRTEPMVHITRIVNNNIYHKVFTKLCKLNYKMFCDLIQSKNVKSIPSYSKAKLFYELMKQ